MRALRTLADTWLVRYPSFSSTKSYTQAPATSHTPFDLSRSPDSNETLADHIPFLNVELPQLLVSSPGLLATEFSLVTATGVPQPRAIYYSIRLISQIQMRPLLTVAEAWLVRYPSFSSMGAIIIPPLRALYHSIPLVRRILMRSLRTHSDHWLLSYLNSE